MIKWNVTRLRVPNLMGMLAKCLYIYILAGHQIILEVVNKTEKFHILQENAISIFFFT